MNDFNKLVKAQDEYITLLVKEIESIVSIAYVHGWRSDNHEAGALLREKIAGLKQETAKAEQEGLRWVDIKDSTPRDGVYSVKCTSWVSGVTMLGVGNIVGGEWVLVTFLNKTTFGKSEILACGKVEYLSESTTPPVKEAGQPADDKPFDENLAYELIARFVANSGKKDSIKKIRKEAFVDGALWAKKYLESRQQPAGESAVWVKVSKRLPVEDGYVCLKVNGGYMGAFVRTMTPPGSNGVRWITDSGGHTIRNWKQAEWLDESGLASSREREVAIAFAEWINRQPYLFGQNDYGWYYDIPVDGAGVDHKLIGNTGDLYQYYLQSSSNT